MPNQHGCELNSVKYYNVTNLITLVFQLHHQYLHKMQLIAPFILLLIVNSVNKVWAPSWSYLKATVLTVPNSLLQTFLPELFLCSCCNAVGLGGLRVL